MDRSEPDTELTDDHMRLLEWLDEHPAGSLTTAARTLGLQLAEVEALCADLVAEGMIERVREPVTSRQRRNQPPLSANDRETVGGVKV